MSSLIKLFGRYILYAEYHARRFYSTLPEALPTPYATAKRSSEDDPSRHSLEQIGLLYTVPPSVNEVLFKYGGLPKNFVANIKTFRETSLMIRSPAVEIIDYMKNTDYNMPVVRYALYGKPGCGKSLTLAHLLHYAYNQNFIIAHVPWVWDWFRNVRHEVVYSETHKGCVDLPILSALWLKHFQSQNSKLLKEADLPVKETYIWNKRESTPAGSHLTELINHGINRVKYASDCVMAIILELKQLSREKKCKTFVAVDGFNAFFGGSTNLKTEDRTPVTPTMVTLTKAFLEATKQDWTNGAVVVVLDQMSARFQSLDSHLPLSLLGRDGFEHLDPFIPVSVVEYSDLELNSIFDYYEDRKWLQNNRGRHELVFLSNCNPYQLMNLCNTY